jgi:SAM-dependent methyltransferase
LKTEQKIDGSKKILDIGSALGTFLKIAKDHGWDVSGVELSEFGADYTRKKYGFEIHHGDITTSIFPAESFDAITMWDVIEHVDAPVANLEKAIELLKPNGILLVTSDTYDCIMAVVGRLLYRLTWGTFTYPVRRLFIPHNKSYFTPGGIEALFDRLNLETVYCKRMEYPLEKIETSFLERQVLRIFYFLGKLLNKQSQFTYLLRRKSA